MSALSIVCFSAVAFWSGKVDDTGETTNLLLLIPSEYYREVHF
jgi:hypothetical protein